MGNIGKIEFTGDVYQGPEFHDGSFIPERDQVYFKMAKEETEFLIGLKDILYCIRFAEKQGELPELGIDWWHRAALLYGKDIYMIECEEDS